MTGPEIVPAMAKAAELAKSALGESEHVEGELLDAAGDSPALRSAADAYARRLAVKQEILLRLFYPLAILVGVSRDYFDTRFPIDMARKTAQTPVENLTPPLASVAVPAMQGLSYSLDEPDLKNMYLNLLATATDARVREDAHPSFAEVIKQLSAREARELLEWLSQDIIPVARLSMKAESGDGLHLMLNHVLAYGAEAGGPQTEEPALPMWVDNWIRLGLVEVDYSRQIVAEGSYDYVRERPEFARLAATDKRGAASVDVEQGLMRITDFGRRFGKAVTTDEEARM